MFANRVSQKRQKTEHTISFTQTIVHVFHIHTQTNDRMKTQISSGAIAQI